MSDRTCEKAWLAFDAYSLKNEAGLGVYTEKVLETLLRKGRGSQMTVFTGGGRSVSRFRALPRSGEARHIEAPGWAAHRLLFEDLWLPVAVKRSGCGVFYNPDFTVPHVSDIKSVITLHDLSFWDMPESSSLNARVLYGYKVPGSARRARRLVVDSNATLRSAMAHGLCPEGKMLRILPGVDRDFKPLPRGKAQKTVAEEFGYDFPFVLGVGTVEPRKNWTVVGEALAGSRSPVLQGLHFVLCGRPGQGGKGIQERLGKMLPGRVHFLNSVGRPSLRSLYSSCELSVYPSLYEGFGLPVLEALACGAPVVTSKTSSLPEAAGGAALLVDPRDTAALARAMVRLQKDRALRKRLERRGANHARKLTWESTADKIWEVLRRVRQEQ